MIKQFYIYAGILLIFGCSSGDSNPEPDPKEIVPPNSATLVFPNKNAECNEGTNITDTESDVTFDWEDAENTTSYQLVLKNLDTQTIAQYNSTVSDLTITILRGTPYAWYVVSNNETAIIARSDTWNFYNAGEAIKSYAPFPAELISPNMGESLSENIPNAFLQWKGNDIDDDIENYDLLFGSSNPPTETVATDIIKSEYLVNVVSGNTYYWLVKTYDSKGNTSNSEVFEFKVN
ncbi:hypothetical protein [Flavisericum labens]|uniref:hypothetical protein n=1 Tax=Flavisericum labens TaxID=3377112 RepID=UPI00387AC726